MLFLACAPSVQLPGVATEIPSIPANTSVEAPDFSEQLYDPTLVHQFELQLSQEAWSDLQTNPWGKSWWPADLWIDGEGPMTQIGVRAFGAGSMISYKSSLKLSFDHFVEGQDWEGVEQIKLDNSSQDPSFLRETIATQILRGMGIPASRSSFARLTVNGVDAGFFVMLEPMDDQFLKRFFEDDQGPLYGMISGRWGQGLTPMDHALDWYEPQTSIGGDGHEIEEAARILASGDADAIETVLDTEGFFRESISRSVMGGYDTFSADGNNFYLYVENGKITIIPWDLDYELGNGAVTTALSVDLSRPDLASPWSANPLSGADYLDPMLAWNLSQGADPQKVVDELLKGPMEWNALDAQIVAKATMIRPEVQTDLLGYGSIFDRAVADLRLFLHSRSAQLAGREVQDCAPLPAGSFSLSQLSPTGTVGWGSLDLDGGYWGPGFTVAGTHYCSGAFAHAPSVISLQIPDGIRILRGKVGLQDWNQVCGDGALFSVTQDGQTLWSSSVLHNYDPAVDLGSLAIQPGTLELRASPNGEYSCDTAVWVDVLVSGA